MKNSIRVLALCLIFIMCVSFVACSGPSDYDDNNGGNAPSDEESTIVTNETNRKIVYTVRLSLENKNVDQLKNILNEKCKALGGYVESSDERYDDGECDFVSLTYRIPTEKLDEFVSSAEGSAKVTNKNVSTSDITTSYVNAQAKKNALLERKNALEAILNDTTTSASDRITVINEISEVNTELQAIEILISEYDSDVNFSTVKITIRQPVSFWDVFLPVFIFCFVIVGACLAVIGVKFYKKKKSKTN